jgi:hypothetical protein
MNAKIARFASRQRRWISILPLALAMEFTGGCVQHQTENVKNLPLASFELSYGNTEIQWSEAKGWFCSPASMFKIPLGKPFVLKLIARVEQPDYPKTYHCAHFAIVSGHLPPGLSIDQSEDSRGSIRGTPTVPGFYPFTVKLSGVTYSHIYIGDVVVANKIIVSVM